MALEKNNKINEEGIDMEERYCTIQESISESLEEVKLMRKNLLPKTTWDEFLKEQSQEESE